jgi:sugar phosphate isomerase/epimerase
VKFQSALGNHRYVVPSLPVEQHNAAGFSRAATRMNEVGAALQRHQGSLYYHNHDFEFKDLAGKTGFDILAAETDPALVRFEVDTYWVEKSGRIAGEFVSRHASRIGMIHAKEFRRRDQSDQPAGEGDIDFPLIVSLAQSNDWPLIVEFEGDGAMQASRKSAAYLRSLLE